MGKIILVLFLFLAVSSCYQNEWCKAGTLTVQLRSGKILTYRNARWRFRKMDDGHMLLKIRTGKRNYSIWMFDVVEFDMNN